MLMPKISRDRNGIWFKWIDRSKGFGAIGRYGTTGPKLFRSVIRWIKAYPRTRRANG